MKGWKTVAFGVILALISVFSNQEMVNFITDHFPWVGGSVGTVIVALRFLTTTPIFKSDE